MSEVYQPFENNGEQRISFSLRRFDSDLTNTVNDAIEFENDLADSFYAIDDKFKEYTQNELKFTEEETDAFLNILRHEEKLPDEMYFRTSPEHGIERYRLAVFCSIAPIYREQHTNAEYECWLPSVMWFAAAPEMGRHELQACTLYKSLSDDECFKGKCPIKVMINETVSAVSEPDFASIAYQLDPLKARRHVSTLLSTARHYMKYFPGDEERRLMGLKKKYEEKYKEMFPDAYQ